jgi:drug/metabolite transporter (DMT)-like permease
MEKGQAPAAPNPKLVVAALVAIQVLFGVNYVITKVVVGVFPPLLWASIRIIISSAVMLSVAILSGRPHPKDGIKFFGPLVIFSLLGIIINQSSFLLGLRYTTSTNSAILNTLIPIFTLALVTLRGQERLTPRRAAGFVCALTGVLMIRKLSEFTFSDKSWIGDLLTIINSLSFACYLTFSKGFLEKHDRVWTVAWLFIYGSVGLTLLGLHDWLTFEWPPMDARLLYCMTFAVLGGTLMTYFLNIWALAHAKSSSVAIFIYAQPIVATLLAWVWMDQEPTLRVILSSALIFIGMILGLTGKDPKANKVKIT